MLEISPLAARDFDEWLPLWLGYLQFYETKLPETTTRGTFARLTGGGEPMGAFLARGDGAAVGMVHWLDHRSCWTPGDYCYLQDLFVASGQRGGGIGRALIEDVTKAARRRGCSRVYWLTKHDNRQAQALYDKLAPKSGFIQYVKRLD